MSKGYYVIEMDCIILVLNILAVILHRNLISDFVYFLSAQRRSQLVSLFDLNTFCYKETLCVSVSFFCCSHAILY